MRAARFAIDRVVLKLPGISQAEAASMTRSFETALVERLVGWRPDVAGVAPMPLGDLDLGSIELAKRLDAAALATLVGDRLAASIEAAIARSREDV